jgi:hypothetical protein
MHPVRRNAVFQHALLDRERAQVSARLWRLRKDHRVIEALTRTRPGSDAVTLTIDYNGEATAVSRWPTCDAAAREADARLREFLRQGWATHW